MALESLISPTMLVILDGFGYSKEIRGNAVQAAKMPFWNWLLKNYPHTLLHASGQHVGLLPGYIGNSEVGHLTLGSGRIVESMLKKIHDSIDDKSFFDNKILLENFIGLKRSGKSLHLMGLLSDGGVHSHEYHLHALLQIAARAGLKNVYVHCFLDGRDVAPKSAALYLKKLQDKVAEFGVGKIASIGGRFYAMDRDKNWDRTEKCYRMLVGDNSNVENIDWQAALQNSYDEQITDEFIIPTLLNSEGCIKSGDGIVFFNFRPDRAWQLAECFLNPNFDKFKANDLCSTSGTLNFFISATRYKAEFSNFNNQILFEQEVVKNTLLDVFASHSKPPKVFIIAETEKYAHVTYFFRGMVDKQMPNEKRVLIPSIKVKNYINNPEMSAPEITKALIKSLQSDPANFYLVNYANPDMVGHSGDIDATAKACECVDRQLEYLYTQVVKNMNGSIFITADHGNAEEKINLTTGQSNTAHTTNLVPFVFVCPKLKIDTALDEWPNQANDGISNVAATILKHMQIDIPEDMVAAISENI